MKTRSRVSEPKTSSAALASSAAASAAAVVAAAVVAAEEAEEAAASADANASPEKRGAASAGRPFQHERKLGVRSRSDIPALDLLLESLHQIGHALQTRIDRERAAIDFERLLVVADILQDESETGHRAEVSRLALEHLADVGDRAAVVLLHVIERGAPVPGLDVIRFDLDDRVEQLEREIGVLSVEC